MAAGVGIAHGVVVGVGVAVLRDGRFQIAQVGVAGGEGAELGVVVPCTQVLQAGLRGVLLAVVGEAPALLRFTLHQAAESNCARLGYFLMLFIFYHIIGRIGELSHVIAEDVFKFVDRSELDHRKRGHLNKNVKPSMPHLNAAYLVGGKGVSSIQKETARQNRYRIPLI